MKPGETLLLSVSHFLKDETQDMEGTGDSSFCHNVEHICTFSLIGFILSAHRTHLNTFDLFMPDLIKNVSVVESSPETTAKLPYPTFIKLRT